MTEPGVPHMEGNDLVDAPSAVERTLAPTKVKFFYKDYAKDPDYRSYEADDFVLADLPTSVFPLRDTMILYHAQILAEAEERVSNPVSEVKTELPRWRSFKLLDVRLEGAKAILTFEDPDYYTSGGSARVIPMRNGYIETAMQFREVEEVEILPLDVFQP